MVTAVADPVVAPAAADEMYRWRSYQAVPKGLKAQTAAEIFNRISARDGALTARAVLDAGKPPDSPLHGAFDWNNDTAAESYRIKQAEGLVRSLVIIRRRRDGALTDAVRAFVRIREMEQIDDDLDPNDPAAMAAFETGNYIPATTAMESPTLRQHLVRQAAIELGWWRRKHAQLKEFADVFAVVDAGTVPVVMPAKQTVRVRRSG